MAAFKLKRGGVEYEIHEWDHLPPHCHVYAHGKHGKIRLDTLKVFWGDVRLTGAMRKVLSEHQAAMIQAWNDKVTIMDDLV